MTKRDIAMEYLRCFCDGDIDGLALLLAPDLKFMGPLHIFTSSEQYLDSLRAEPPEKSRYEILSITENDDSIVVFYVYFKLKQVMVIAQLFNISNGKIDEILLVFDTRD